MCGATATPARRAWSRTRGMPVIPPFVVRSMRSTSTASWPSSACGMVRATLLVAHRHRGRRRRSALGNQRGIAGRHEVLDPAELEVGDAGVEAGDVVGGPEDHVGVEADPTVGCRVPGGPQPFHGGVEVGSDRDLEAAPAGGPQLADLFGDRLGTERRWVPDDRRRREADRVGSADGGGDRDPADLAARGPRRRCRRSTGCACRSPRRARRGWSTGCRSTPGAGRRPERRRSAGRSSGRRSPGSARRASGSRRTPTCRRRRRCARARTRGDASPRRRRRSAPPARRESAPSGSA